MTDVRIVPEEVDLDRARYEAMPLEQKTLAFRTFLERRAEVEKIPTTTRRLAFKFENWLGSYDDLYYVLVFVGAGYTALTVGDHYKSIGLMLLTFVALLFAPLAVRRLLVWAYFKPRYIRALAEWKYEGVLWFRHRILPEEIPIDDLLKNWEAVRGLYASGELPNSYYGMFQARKEDNEKKWRATLKMETTYRALVTLADTVSDIQGELDELGEHGLVLQTFIKEQGTAISNLQLDALKKLYGGVPPECFDPRG